MQNFKRKFNEAFNIESDQKHMIKQIQKIFKGSDQQDQKLKTLLNQYEIKKKTEPFNSFSDLQNNNREDSRSQSNERSHNEQTRDMWQEQQPNNGEIKKKQKLINQSESMNIEEEQNCRSKKQLIALERIPYVQLKEQVPSRKNSLQSDKSFSAVSIIRTETLVKEEEVDNDNGDDESKIQFENNEIKQKIKQEDDLQLNNRNQIQSQEHLIQVKKNQNKLNQQEKNNQEIKKEQQKSSSSESEDNQEVDKEISNEEQQENNDGLKVQEIKSSSEESEDDEESGEDRITSCEECQGPLTQSQTQSRIRNCSNECPIGPPFKTGNWTRCSECKHQFYKYQSMRKSICKQSCFDHVHQQIELRDMRQNQD